MIDGPAALRGAERAIDGGSELSTSIDEHFLVASPVLANDGVPVMALVLSVPRSQIDATREDLFRVLFLVAMGAAAIALALASLAGERIGAELGRAARRDRVGQYVEICVVVGCLKKTQDTG